jgi:DNA-binding protein HU-beta
MKKSELIVSVAKRAGLTQKEAGKALDTLLEVIQEEVVAGNEVQLYNFGTFARGLRAERNGVNPSSKQPITIPAHYTPSFKAGEGFRRQLKDLPVEA